MRILYSAHSGTCWLLLIRILDVTVVDAMLPSVPIEVSDSFEFARDNRDGVLRASGDRVTLARGTNIPYLSGHSKYLQNICAINSMHCFGYINIYLSHAVSQWIMVGQQSHQATSARDTFHCHLYLLTDDATTLPFIHSSDYSFHIQIKWQLASIKESICDQHPPN